jgi:hypothetical protein
VFGLFGGYCLIRSDTRDAIWTTYYPQRPLSDDLTFAVKERLQEALNKVRAFVGSGILHSDNLRINLFFPDETLTGNQKTLYLTIPHDLEIGLNHNERAFSLAPNEGVTGVCFIKGKAVATRAIWTHESDCPTISGWRQIILPVTKDSITSFYLSQKKAAELPSMDWILSIPLFYNDGVRKCSFGVMNIDCVHQADPYSQLSDERIVEIYDMAQPMAEGISKLFTSKKGSCSKMHLQAFR